MIRWQDLDYAPNRESKEVFETLSASQKRQTSKVRLEPSESQNDENRSRFIDTVLARVRSKQEPR
jgi:hypothetical protein